MAEYRTEQKQQLLNFLRNHGDTAFTIEELAAALRSERSERAPGKSTLYRQITRMVEEGSVKRIVQGNSRHFVYQIIKSDRCHSHLHMKCVGCGRLLHLDDGLSKELLEQVRRNSAFSVDEEATVLFGRCEGCALRRVKNES